MSSSPTTSLTRKGQATRRTIETVARGLFADPGYLRTTIADITRASGLSTAAFYRYFDDKEDLLLNLAETLAEQVFSLARTQTPPEADQYGYFEAAATAYWNVYRDNAGIYGGLFQLAMVDDRARHVWLRLRDEGVTSIERTLVYATKHGFAQVADTRATAEALSSMFEHACFMWLGAGGQPRDADDAVTALAEVWYRTCCHPTT